MRHLAAFFGQLSMPCRVSYLPLLHDLLHSTNPFNWRLRQCLAVQLPDLLKLPPPDMCFQTLFPLVMTLLQDPVASVRRDSFRGVARMLLILCDQANALNPQNDSSYVPVFAPPPGLDEDTPEAEQQLIALAINASHQVDVVTKAINTLVRGDNYQLRQLWAELSLALLDELPQFLFEKFFLDGLLYLTSDAVLNVRVAVGNVLTGWSIDSEPFVDGGAGSPWTWLLTRPDVRDCVCRLSVDDRDVYISLSKLHGFFPDIEFSFVSCRGRKEAPGGAVPVVNAVTGTLSVLASSPPSDEATLMSGEGKGSEDGEEDRSNYALSSDGGDSAETDEGVVGGSFIGLDRVNDVKGGRSEGSPSPAMDGGGGMSLQQPADDGAAKRAGEASSPVTSSIRRGRSGSFTGGGTPGTPSSVDKRNQSPMAMRMRRPSQERMTMSDDIVGAHMGDGEADPFRFMGLQSPGRAHIDFSPEQLRQQEREREEERLLHKMLISSGGESGDSLVEEELSNLSLEASLDLDPLMDPMNEGFVGAPGRRRGNHGYPVFGLGSNSSRGSYDSDEDDEEEEEPTVPVTAAVADDDDDNPPRTEANRTTQSDTHPIPPLPPVDSDR